MSKRIGGSGHQVPLDDLLSGVHETMPADARAAVRARVVAHAASGGRVARAKLVFTRSVVAFTTTTALLTGTAYAAASTVPGDALYPVKRAAEELRLAFSPQAQQDEALMKMTRERASEVRALLEAEASTSDVENAADDFGQAAGRAVDSQATSQAAAAVAREIEKSVSEQPAAVRDAVQDKVPQTAPAPTPAPQPAPQPDPPSDASPAPKPDPSASPGAGAQQDSSGSGVSSPRR